jgi:hypothetical protein
MIYIYMYMTYIYTYIYDIWYIYMAYDIWYICMIYKYVESSHLDLDYKSFTK